MGTGGKNDPVPDLCRGLGVPLRRVGFLDWDTSSVPDSGPTVASRGTLVGGNATKHACEQLLGEIHGVVAEVLQVGRGELISSEGEVRSKKNPELRLSFEDAVAECRKRGKRLVAVGWYQAPPTGWIQRQGRAFPF